jgi:hypothetical protein
METLEFTMDADRYRSVHANFMAAQAAGFSEGSEHVCSLWHKIINAYIIPYGHREVNLPARVRDRLLSLPAAPVPPHPSELDEAVRIVYELMNDSVLGPFLASVTPHHVELVGIDGQDARQARSRVRMPREMSSSSDESSRSPKMGFLPMLTIPWTSEPKSSASSTSDAAERGGLTDGSINTPSPTGNEPMTPPTTPPMSDWAFSSKTLIGPHSSGWKKMGAKLGLNRMGRSKRGHSSATSAPVDVDIPMRDPDHGRRNTNPL